MKYLLTVGGGVGVIEEIEERWDRLKLNEEENNLIEVKCSELDQVKKKWERS